MLHKTVAFQEHSHPPPRVHICTHGVVLSALQGFKSCLSHLLACNLRLCIYCLLSVSTCQWEPVLDLAHSTAVRMLGVSTGNTLSMETTTCGSCRHIFLCYFKSDASVRSVLTEYLQHARPKPLSASAKRPALEPGS